MQRSVNIPESNSFFLFGARGTGKSWLLRERLPAEQTHYIDLLTARDFEELSQRPELLSERIARLGVGLQWVVIDEVQRVPEILNMVHLEIEAHSRSRMGVGQERAPKSGNFFLRLLAPVPGSYGEVKQIYSLAGHFCDTFIHSPIRNSHHHML